MLCNTKNHTDAQCGSVLESHTETEILSKHRKGSKAVELADPLSAEHETQFQK